MSYRIQNGYKFKGLLVLSKKVFELYDSLVHILSYSDRRNLLEELIIEPQESLKLDHTTY